MEIIKESPIEFTILGVAGFRMRIRCSSEKIGLKVHQFVATSSQVKISNEYRLREYMSILAGELKGKDFILIDGNNLYNTARLIKDFKALIADYRVEKFTDYLYHFFTLRCGSIAHYDKVGWFNCYDSVEALKKFFIRNEYGVPVLGSRPLWDYDATIAQKQMTELLGVVDVRHVQTSGMSC